MLNKIIQLSLRNRVVVIILAGLLLLAGTTVLLRMEVDIFPDLNAPTVVVMTEAPGFAPEEVEKLVTFPVETAVNGATDVRRVRSSSATGFSVVWVEFDWGTDIYRARQIVSEKLAAVAETLPPGVSTPVLGPQSSILGEIIIIGLTSDSTSMGDLRTLADRVIRPRLLAMGGVSQVSVIGGDIKEYQIKIGALIIILMLLYSEFRDMKESLIILINMPLAMIGGIIILCCTSGELNIPAIIGFISLLGITTRNGMLLISRYNHLLAEGQGFMECIRRGSTDRLLPIVMTALTSALALIPLALRGGEPGNEIQSPMAIVILGGLLTSTVLNIFIVPIVFYLTYHNRIKK